jgi:hypothetical protein
VLLIVFGGGFRATEGSPETVGHPPTSTVAAGGVGAGGTTTGVDVLISSGAGAADSGLTDPGGTGSDENPS